MAGSSLETISPLLRWTLHIPSFTFEKIGLWSSSTGGAGYFGREYTIVPKFKRYVRSPILIVLQKWSKRDIAGGCLIFGNFGWNVGCGKKCWLHIANH